MMGNSSRRSVKQNCIIPITLFVLVSPCLILAQTSQRFIRQGDAAYQQFDNLNALAYYKKACGVAPEHFECLAKTVRAYNDIGEDLNSKESESHFEQAVQHAEQLFTQFPEKAETYYWLAVSYGNLALLRGGKEKVKLSGYVKKNIQKAITLNPDYADAYVVLGIYYKEVAGLNSFLKAFARIFLGELPDGTYNDAVKAFRKAIALQTTNPVYTYFHLGRTYEQTGEVEKAKSLYQHALQLPSGDHQDHAITRRIQSRLHSL